MIHQLNEINLNLVLDALKGTLHFIDIQAATEYQSRQLKFLNIGGFFSPKV